VITFAVLTVSDRSAAGIRPDLSGPALIKGVETEGHRVNVVAVVPDEFDAIRNILTDWCDSDVYDVILTTGGTGFAPRDITPEATLAVVQRLAPGISEAIRAGSLTITPHAMLSRAIAGIRGRTLIINLPGSPKAALENLQIVMPVLEHAVSLLREKPDAESRHKARI